MTKPFMKAGWTFVVDSWENDDDNNLTEQHTATTLAEVKALVDLIKLFKDPEVSNLADPNEAEFAALARKARGWINDHLEFVKTQTTSHDFDLWEDEEIADHFASVAADLGLANTGEFYTRVVESWKIYYNETDVVLNDVTAEYNV